MELLEHHVGCLTAVLQRELLRVFLLIAFAYCVMRIWRSCINILRLKNWGNHIPGPKESWLRGNAREMTDAGGLAFFLTYLHDRSTPQSSTGRTMPFVLSLQMANNKMADS